MDYRPRQSAASPDSAMKRPLPLLLVLPAMLSAQEPRQLASDGRLWLKVPAGQAPLREVRVSSGSATQAPWEKDSAVRERQTDILFPVRWWSWSELTVSFTSPQDGTVELSLNGPWSPDVDGKMPRKEILWDSISAVGAEIQNGGFEETTDKRPSAWNSPWGAYPAAESWPLAGAGAMAGKSVGSSWCQRPLVQTLKVKAGGMVTLKLHAKAATPPGFVAPARLGNDTAAHRAVARLKRGVNLGNGWESPPPGGWGVKFTVDDIDHIAAEGFDHIRVPVAWHFRLQQKDGGYEIDPAFLTEIDPVLRRALDKKLHVILNWHHFHDFTKDPQGNLDRFTGGWKAISDHYQSWPPGLFFELLNEPCDALTTEAANPIYRKTIATIRKTNPERIIVASPGHWGIIGELENLRLPDDDDRIVATVHCYDPFQFTHQGAGWVGFQNLRGIVYPGPPATPFQLPDSMRDDAGLRSFVEKYNTLRGDENPCSPRAVRELLDTAAAWSAHFGRPVYLGEFGSNNAGDPESRARYLRDVRTMAESRKIPWSLWEWKSGFGYWDPKTNQPLFRKSVFE